MSYLNDFSQKNALILAGIFAGFSIENADDMSLRIGYGAVGFLFLVISRINLFNKERAPLLNGANSKHTLNRKQKYV